MRWFWNLHVHITKSIIILYYRNANPYAIFTIFFSSLYIIIIMFCYTLRMMGASDEDTTITTYVGISIKYCALYYIIYRGC